MELRFLGGAGEIGRSAVLVNDALLLDFGTMSGNPPSFPVETPDAEAVVVSHGHLDHAGSVPSLLSGDARPPIHWTPPTEELALLLARDTLKLHGGRYDCPFTEEAVKRVTEVARRHGYGEPFEAAGHEVTLLDAGHIPGSAHVLVDDGETRLLYTGDYHTDDHRSDDVAPSRVDRHGRPIRGQRLVAGSTARPDADVVVTESTYADTDHEARSTLERRFVESLETTLWEGGTAVVPAFAIGRTQEVMCILADHDVPCYVDGMGQQVTRLFRRHPDFLRDAGALRRATSHARFVTGRDGQRERIAEQSTVIVTTSGMLSGGPAMTYLPAVLDHPVNKIALTGFQVPGTPGRELLDTGSAEIAGQVRPVSAQVEQYDFSAHADRGGLRSFLESYRDARVLVVHGDDTAGYADRLATDGFDAAAPAVGEMVTV